MVVAPNLKVPTKFIFENLKLKKFTKKNHFVDFLNLNNAKIKLNSDQQPIWMYGKNDLEETACQYYSIIKKNLDLLKYVTKPFGINETSCRLSGTGGAIFCTVDSKKKTQEIFKRLNEEFKKNNMLTKSKIKICELN